MSEFCDLCGLYLTGLDSRADGRCEDCRKEHGNRSGPRQRIEIARAILSACGECPSCEQGHPERCTRGSRP